MKHPDEMTDGELISDAINKLANRVHLAGGESGPESLAAAVWEVSNSLDRIADALFDVAEAVREGAQ